MKISRRTLTAVLTLALFAVPFSATAQQAHVYRVGVVFLGGSYARAIDGLRDGLREPGLQKGKHFVLDVRDVKGDLNSVGATARSLEEAKVDLIYVTVTLMMRGRRTTRCTGPELALLAPPSVPG
jgi:ABC-type uncharacterized transport system substrate-binding protein